MLSVSSARRSSHWCCALPASSVSACSTSVSTHRACRCEPRNGDSRRAAPPRTGGSFRAASSAVQRRVATTEQALSISDCTVRGRRPRHLCRLESAAGGEHTEPSEQSAPLRRVASYDQSIVARSVCCLGSLSRPPSEGRVAGETLEKLSRAEQRLRAAASSIASGRSSSRRQSSHRRVALSSIPTRARAQQRVPRRPCGEGRHRPGCPRRNLESVRDSSRGAEALGTGATSSRQIQGEVGKEMLCVVADQHERACRESLADGVESADQAARGFLRRRAIEIIATTGDLEAARAPPRRCRRDSGRRLRRLPGGRAGSFRCRRGR